MLPTKIRVALAKKGISAYKLSHNVEGISHEIVYRILRGEKVKNPSPKREEAKKRMEEQLGIKL